MDSRTVSRRVSEAASGAKEYMGQAKEYLGQAKDTAAEWAKKGERQIHRRPYTSVFLTLGVGLCLGAVIGFLAARVTE